MNLIRKRVSKSEKNLIHINDKSLNKYFNNSSEDILLEIDNILNKMNDIQIKSITLKIFYLFKNNKYEEIPFNNIIYQFLQEYKSYPSHFLDSKNIQISSKAKLLKNLELLKEYECFSFVNTNEKLKLNLPKALEFLKD